MSYGSLTLREARPAARRPSSCNDPPPKAYPSRPLQDGEFRVLHLCPARSIQMRIECSLEIFKLSNKPNFEALSYTWGSLRDQRAIRLDSTSAFGVTDNLWHALRRLRHGRSVRTLWIDALCINQQDLEERGRQVQRMLDIYRAAQAVIVWLGEPKLRVAASGNNSAATHQPATSEPVGAVKELPRALVALSDESRYQWWDRAWVVQEIAAAHHVDVYLGRLQLPWSSFIANVPLYDFPIRVLRGDTSRIGSSSLLHDRLGDLTSVVSWDPTEKRTLSDLVKVTKGSSATDSRDKIYSLLGLLKPEYLEIIKVDYRKDTLRLFAEATFATIRLQGNFDALFSIRFHPWLWYRSHRPSWTIDFTVWENEDSRSNEGATLWVSQGMPPLVGSPSNVSLSSPSCGTALLSANGRQLESLNKVSLMIASTWEREEQFSRKAGNQSGFDQIYKRFLQSVHCWASGESSLISWLAHHACRRIHKQHSPDKTHYLDSYASREWIDTLWGLFEAWELLFAPPKVIPHDWQVLKLGEGRDPFVQFG